MKHRRLGFVWLALMLSGTPLRAASLQSRIDAAPAGAVLAIPAGVYDGALTIDKPLTLHAEPGAEIRGDGRGHVISIHADHVTVEGFRISGSGLDLGRDHAAIFVQGNFALIKGNRIEDALHGVYIKKANDCRIVGNTIRGKVTVGEPVDRDGFRPDGGETCEAGLNQNRRGNGIHIWNSARAAIIGNDIRNVRDGIYFSFCNRSQVIANTVTQARFGLHYMYSDYNYFEENRFDRSAAGAVVMVSKGLLIRRNTFSANVGHRAYGLVMLSVDDSRLEENRFESNRIGLFLELSNTNTVVGNAILRSYIGVRLTGSSDDNRFSNNRFRGNLHPVEIDGSVGDNVWAVEGVGNHWASSEIDLNGDGVGDLPHRETDLLGALRRPFPLVALLSGSPALDLVRFAQQNAALPGVPAIVDPAPLIHPPPGGVRP